MDARLAAPGRLGRLVQVIATALSSHEDVTACAQRINFSPAKLRQQSTAEDYWQSLIVAASENWKLDELLRDVEKKLAGTIHEQSLRAWYSTVGSPEHVNESAAECARLLAEIRTFPDPRDAQAQLRVLSGLLNGLIESLAAKGVSDSLFGGLPDSKTSARTTVARARRASGDVDQTLHGVRIAQTTLGRLGRHAGPSDIFGAELSIVGQLLDARARLDESMTDLLEALYAVLPEAHDT